MKEAIVTEREPWIWVAMPVLIGFACGAGVALAGVIVALHAGLLK